MRENGRNMACNEKVARDHWMLGATLFMNVKAIKTRDILRAGSCFHSNFFQQILPSLSLSPQQMRKSTAKTIEFTWGQMSSIEEMLKCQIQALKLEMLNDIGLEICFKIFEKYNCWHLFESEHRL